MRLAIFYTGDLRHNTSLTYKNHKKLFEKIKRIIPFEVYYFTRNDLKRGQCPYDSDQPDNVYRRGQGGAVQVWDFMRGVQRTNEEIVLRLRTDLWFTETSMDCICYELKEMIENRSGVAYFGSDWVNGTAGAINIRLPVHIDSDSVIQDFVVLARRDSLKDFDTVMSDLDKLNPNKRRSGNKTFRFIIPTETAAWTPDSEMLSATGLRKQLVPAHRILCQIWLVRKTYSDYPTDDEVCKDYIQSYIVDDKAKAGKKNLILPHPMTEAVNWWRLSRGWSPTEIKIGDWWRWQSE